mmetsp:Transcript_18233/g.48142  ORF Transcript_18233/g.48142 Transcript_18233/m.48142 type:complete len:228 (-) Transcript_18233:2-685(-)
MRQVKTVSGRAAHKQRVLLHDPEAGRRLARAGDVPVPPVGDADVGCGARGGCDTRGARESVERCPLPKQDVASRAAYDRADHLAAARVDDVALLLPPLDRAPKVVEDGVEEGNAREHAVALAIQVGFLVLLAHHEAANVDRRHVVAHPPVHLLAPVRRQQVREVLLLAGRRVEGRGAGAPALLGGAAGRSLLAFRGTHRARASRARRRRGGGGGGAVQPRAAVMMRR